MNKFTAIYVCRSVSDADKGNNLLSIEVQKEECIRFSGGDANYKMYCDYVKSGKDIAHHTIWKLPEDVIRGNGKTVERKSQKKLDRRNV